MKDNEDDDAGAAKKKRQNDDEQDYDESENESGDEQDEQDDSKDNEIDKSRLEEGGVSEIDYKNAREYVLSTYSKVKEYEFDKDNELWCKLTFDVSSPLSRQTIVRELLRDNSGLFTVAADQQKYRFFHTLARSGSHIRHTRGEGYQTSHYPSKG